MYILIRKDDTKVLGFTVWSGFGEEQSISGSFNDVSVVSFDNDEKSVTVRLYSTVEYATKEAIRISKIIKEVHDKDITLQCLPLFAYIRQVENWS